MIICLMALLAGGVIALYAPVAQFVVGLVCVTAGGLLTALVAGLPAGRVLPWGAALYASAQVGYALGLGGIAIYKARQSTATLRVPDVRPEREPLLK